MEFNYYYGTQADQFSFIRIPRTMLTDKMFAELSLQAKVLYGLLLDRMGLSMKNGWVDKDNKVYIIYQIAEIQEDLGFSKKKAIDYLAELETFGLIEKKRRGLGLASIIYVKSFIVESVQLADEVNVSQDKISRSTVLGTSGEVDGLKNEHSNQAEIAEQDVIVAEHIEEEPVSLQGNCTKLSRSVETGTSRSVELGTSGSVKIAPQEVSIREPLEVPKQEPLKNYNNINYTYRNDNKPNHIVSVPDEMGYDMRTAYAEQIKENIGLELLCQRNPHMKEQLWGIYDLILETVLCRSDTILIASNHYPAELVRNKFLRLDSTHVEYVLECLQTNTTKVKNIKKYLLAALFNAPTTIDGYYQAEVNHDMPQFVKTG